jgi:hypothetical protein
MNGCNTSQSMTVPFALLSWAEPRGVRSLPFRRPRQGPETALVEWFLDRWPLRTPRGCGVTVFREPRLESGIPDLVVVMWDIKAAERWNPNRAAFQKADYQLMQLIRSSGSLRDRMVPHLSTRTLSKQLTRLEEAQMIRRKSNGWMPAPLSETFAARHIIAIEAKMSEWTAALMQARLNTWFASASYVLLPHVPRRSAVLERAQSHGVGVWTRAVDTKAVSLPATRKLPLSYASWLFNDWACHHAWSHRKHDA